MNEPEQRTIVTDIDIPFPRLVVLVLKLMLASIPALILFYVIFFIGFLIVMLFFGGGAALLNNWSQQLHR